MSDEIFFDGKRYISANEAAVSADLTRDYIARLCRDGKISGRRVGKHWYVEQASLNAFLINQEYLKSRRSESLADERVRQYHGTNGTTGNEFIKKPSPIQLTSTPTRSVPSVMDAPALVPAAAELSRVISSRADEIKNKMALAVAAQSRDGVKSKLLFSAPGGFAHAALSGAHVPVYALTPITEFFHKVVALALTLMLTFGTYAAVDPTYARFAAESVRENVNTALDSYRAATGGGLNEFANRAQTQVAAVAENPASAMLAVRGAVTFGLPRAAANFARAFNEHVDKFVFAIAFPAALVLSQSFVGSSETGSVAVEIAPNPNVDALSSSGNSASIQTSASTQTTNGSTALTASNPVYPERVERVVERIVETTRLVSQGGITEEILDRKIAALDAKLSSQLFTSSAAQTTNVTNVYASAASAARIEHLDALDLTNPTITGGSITSAGISNADSLSVVGDTSLATTTITGDLTVTGAVNFTGGTFSVTDATFTNATTTNATSTNSYISNLSAVTASTTNLTWVNATGTNSTSTNLYASWFVAGNATTTNFFSTNASTTNATSTNLFSVLSNFTTSVISTLTATIATITDLVATNLTATNATTTNATSTNSYITNLGAITASTTNLTFGNATGTAATTTSLYSTTASSTNLYSTNGNISVLSAGTLTLTNDLSVANGGTGASTLTGLLQGNGTSAFTAISDSSTVGQLLRVSGASTYAWGALDLADSDAVTGDLPFANLTQVDAASILGNPTGSTADARSVATSTLFGVGTPGYVLTFIDGQSSWVATSTLATITGTLAVAKGGTGATSFGQGWVYSDGSSALAASTSPTVNYITATSTTATSSIATGGFAVGGSQFVVQQNSGRVGIGTASPTTGLDVGVATKISGDLTISGGSALTISASGPVNQTGTGQVTFAGNVDATNGLDVTNANFTVGGSNFTVAQGTGNTTIAGTLGLTGAFNASSTLQATGAARLYSTLQTDGTLTAAAAGTGLSVTNNASIGGTLALTGAGTFASTLAISGVLTAATSTFLGDVALSGKKITGVATPAADTDAANKTYVDSVAQGLSLKDSVVAGTTANITLSGEQTIDGVSLVVGNRVLVKDQTDQTKNGIYVVASGAWSRSTDADENSEVSSGMFTFITDGTLNASSGWVLTTTGAITLGTSLLTFTQFSGAGQIIAGTGISKSGNTLNVGGTADRITANADTIDIASTYVGQTSITTVGALTSGSLGTGFGNINIGASTITGGVATFSSIVGSAINGTGDLTISGSGTFSNALSVLGTLTAATTTFSGDVALGGKKITGLADPTAAQEAATKAYVDAIAQGLTVKASVRVATTTNITLSGTQTIDGVSAIAGDRVLVMGQSTAPSNGIYVVAAGAWSRSTDANENSEVVSGMYTFVTEGTAYANTGWSLITPNVITLDTTALTFTQFSGSAETTAGDGLTKSGNTINAVGTADRITVTADAIDISSSYVGQSSLTTVGALTSGSIGSGFSSINIGSSALTAGTSIFQSATSYGTLSVGGTATTSIVGNSATSTFSGGISLTSGNVNVATGYGFFINNASVLNATTLGSSVLASSLTSVGGLDSGSITTGFGAINIGADTLDAGATVLASLTVSGNTTLANATSTTMFATIASSTNLYSTNGNISALTAGTLTLTNDLAVAQGGTGASTLTGLLQGNGTSAFTAITDSSTVGQLLRVTGASTYAWGALDLADSDAITGDLPFANLTQVAANSVLGNITGSTADAASIATSSLFTWTGTGDVARATSPTFVTPLLGTPSSATLTNATGLLPSGINLTKGNFLVGNDAGIAQATSSIFISSTGNVGIGTTTPQWLLNPFSSTASQLALSAGAGIAQWAFRNAGGNLYFATTTVAGTATTTTSALTINGSSGKVGIGTAGPEAALTVSGNSASSLAPTVAGVHLGSQQNYAAIELFDTSGAQIDFSGTSGRDYDFRQAFSPVTNSFGIEASTTGAIMTWLGNGFVGIGTSTPGSLLSLGDTGANTINISATATSTFGSGIDIRTGCFAINGECVGGSAAAGAEGNIQFYSGGLLAASSSLTFSTAGNFGIGTSTPWAKLSVAGAAGGTAPLFTISSSTAAFATTTVFHIDSNGNVGVGTTTPDGKFSVTGSGTGTGILAKFFNSAFTAVMSVLDNGTAYFLGNVGIGTTTPLARLFVLTTNGKTTASDLGGITIGANDASNQLQLITTLVGGASSAARYGSIQVTEQGSATNNLVLNGAGGNVGIGTTVPEARTQITGGGLCVGSDANCNTDNNTEGHVYAAGVDMEVYDVAENYPTRDAGIGFADIVALDTERGVFVKKADSTSSPQARILGVISERPALLLGGFNGAQFAEERQVAVGLSGRIPVKVNLEGGAIAIGDELSLSSVPGVAKKAADGEQSIGYALENWGALQQEGNLGTGTIQFFITHGTLAGLSVASLTQELSHQPAPDSLAGTFLVNLFARVTEWLADASNGIQEVFARTFRASDKLCINDTCVNEDQLKALLAGQNGAQTASAAGSGTSDGSTSSPQDTIAPVLTLNGENPTTINTGETYADMGVTASDNVDPQVFVYTSVDGGPTIQPGQMVTLDTTEAADHSIEFTVTDEAGNTTTATRTVHVVLPQAVPAPVEPSSSGSRESANSSTDSPAPEESPTPTETPAPESATDSGAAEAGSTNSPQAAPPAEAPAVVPEAPAPATTP